MMASSEKNPFDSTDEETEAEPKIKTESPKNKVFEPEPEDQQMVVKAACECSNCMHWMKSADWSTPNLEFEGHCKTVYKERKIHPLLKSEKYPGKVPKILTFNSDAVTKVEKQAVFKTLVHGEVVPQPVEKCSDTYFSEEIQKSLEKLNYKYSMPIQAFAWPAIFRQMNVFMVGGAKSGKTISYLPAVCTFSTMSEPRYEELAKYKSPLVLIVCSNSQQCEEIYFLIKTFSENVGKNKLKVNIITYPVTHFITADILITLPESLLYCLQKRMFNLKRLCHLVFEEASILFADNRDSMYKILEVVDQMLEHRLNSSKVQLIVSSKKWTSELKKLYKSLYVSPLVVIGDYLEAALYGSIQFEVKFMLSEHKKKYLQGILENKSHIYKTIVICNNEEVTKVNKWLVRNGIQTIALSDDSSNVEIEASEEEWLYAPGGRFKVLLCTDFVFDSLLCVNNAMWLINYSFPPTWTRFTKRFSALSSNLQNPWEQNKDGDVKCKSFIMIDETCESQMAKVLNLFKRLSKDMPLNYQEYARGFKTQTETNKIDNNIPLCSILKLFGKCPNAFCEQRHLLREKLDISEDLPKSGKIVFKILNMKNVTQYTVQLIRHIDLNGVSREINNDDLKKPLKYDEFDDEIIQAQNIEVGRFYAHCDYTTEGEVLNLCHVISIKDQTFVEVKLSNGLVLQTLKTKLCELPLNLQIVDVYMCNLIPPFSDHNFSGRSLHVTSNSLENVQYKNMLLTGDIFLQLDNTLWLNNVVQLFRVDKCDVIKFNLTKHLINLQVVEFSNGQIDSLHKLCAECDIELPVYVKNNAKKIVKEKEIEPQRAWLDDNIHEVILSSAVAPDEFYVRLAKFQPLLENLEKDIQDSVQTEIPDKTVNVEIGKFYLALDPSGQMYSRVLVLQVEEAKALCFYVDYGDESVIEVSKLKILPSKFITKLPFQAIQCRLYGLSPPYGEWSNEATDVLYKFLLEPDSDIFRSLYVQCLDKGDSDTVRTKTKYSVLLKDGFGENNVLINQLFLDCGFATSIFEKIEDFEIPQPLVVDESDSDSSPNEIEDEQDDIEQEMEELFGEECDLELFDADEFLEMVGITLPREPELRQLTHEKPQINGSNTSNSPEQMTYNEVEDGKKCWTPEVYWSQTDTTIKLKIKLIDVGNYKTNIIKKRIFIFSTVLEGRNYELKFTLHKPVELGKHRALGQEVQILLKKIEPLDWLQLTATQQRMRFIHYEIPNEPEKPRRKFLQLDIPDVESDSDEEKPMIHEFSDMESDFDQEIVSSSSE